MPKKQQLISFDTAKLLTRFPDFVEYDAPMSYFVGDDKLRFCEIGELIGSGRSNEDTFLIPAPTQTTVCDYLRERHNIHITVHAEMSVFADKRVYMYLIEEFVMGKFFITLENNITEYETYESALETALMYVLEKLIKDKNLESNE